MNPQRVSSIPDVRQLSDDEVDVELEACVQAGRENDVRVLVYLMEVEERGIYLLRAYSSMHDYCMRRLKLSEGQAQRRIAAARLARDYPFVLPLLERGETHISTLAQIKPFVNRANVHALVADTAGRSRDEVNRILGRPVGLPPASSTRGVIPIDEELEGLIRRAFELECHAVPDGDRLKLAKRAFRALIADGEKKQRAKTDRPRPGPKKATKTIPRSSTRAMFEKHGEQCSYVDPTTGERCPSRVFLQRNHRKMRVHGGTHEPENLEPLCGPHNRYLAALALGRERIARAIRLRQQMDGDGDGDEPPAD